MLGNSMHMTCATCKVVGVYRIVGGNRIGLQPLRSSLLQGAVVPSVCFILKKTSYPTSFAQTQMLASAYPCVP